ncbi:MAGE-like protein 2 [Anopheles darlingi]|uniref:MAGE-like protein 2 n=1 Tax=Anopheles darlingi TaxID=43151 RepID=UPI0021002937|nr:MAGE-like protein 2 [Anopheles darlingi]
MSPLMCCSSVVTVGLLLLVLQGAIQEANGKYVYNDSEENVLDVKYLEALENLKEAHAHAGGQIHSTVSEKSKSYPVPVFQKVGVPVPHPVPIAVPHYIKVYIPQPYPLQVNVEQPIKIPIYKVIPKVIEKPVPYTVEKPYPIEVEKPFPVEVLKKIEVPVPKPFPVPVTVYKHIMQNEKTHRNWHF